MFLTQPPIYGVNAWALVLDIDWDYTMTWFSASLLIQVHVTRWRPSICATKMLVQFVYARKRYVAISASGRGKSYDYYITYK